MIKNISTPVLLAILVAAAVFAISQPKPAKADMLSGYVAEHREIQHRIWHHFQLVSERPDWDSCEK